jgi:hypothetical protein
MFHATPPAAGNANLHAATGLAIASNSAQWAGSCLRGGHLRRLSVIALAPSIVLADDAG